MPSVQALPPRQAVEEYLAHIGVDRDYSPNTVAAYRRDLATFLRFMDEHGATALTSIDRDLLRGYQRSLAHLAASSRARMLTSLRGFFRFLVREEQVSAALGLWIDLPRRGDTLPKPLEPVDLDRLLTGMPGESLAQLRDRALVFFLYSTGARISEALAVNRDQLRGESKQVLIRGKGGRERYVILTDTARAMVAAYLQAREDLEPALFINFDHCPPGSKGGGPGANRGRRLTPAGARQVLRQLSLALGIPPFSPHQLRHTAGTELLPISDARFVQEVLGHRDIKTVAVYAKIRDRRRDQVYGEFDRLMKRPEPDPGPEEPGSGG